MLSREEAMKAIALFLGLFLMIASAKAETIKACDADKYIDKLVTAEGVVDEVHHAASGKVIFLDLCGHYPNYALAIPLFSKDAPKFPDIDSLEGKAIEVKGVIKLYQGRPEIILNDPEQIKVK
jgi:hypothetical protein